VLPKVPKFKVDIIVAPLYNKKFYLGIDFLDMVKALLMPHNVHHGYGAILCFSHEEGD